MKNVLFSLLISILIFSCGNDGKDKDKKEFKDICECAKWSMDISEEILEMTNSEIRDEFEDYKSLDDYYKKEHPECRDMIDEWNDNWKEENERGSRQRDFERYLKNECDVRFNKLESIWDEADDRVRTSYRRNSKREKARDSRRNYSGYGDATMDAYPSENRHSDEPSYNYEYDGYGDAAEEAYPSEDYYGGYDGYGDASGDAEYYYYDDYKK